MDNGVGQERLSKDDKLRCSAVIVSAAEVYPYFARIANTWQCHVQLAVGEAADAFDSLQASICVEHRLAKEDGYPLKCLALWDSGAARYACQLPNTVR